MIGFGQFAGAQIGTAGIHPMPLPETLDLTAVFAAVEASGGRAVRDGWESAGTAQWVVNAFVSNSLVPPPFVQLDYFRPIDTGQSGASFRYDIATGQITRTR